MIPDTFLIYDYATWNWQITLAFALAIFIAIEIMSRGIPALFGLCYGNDIEIKAAHLDKLEPIDYAFITFNKFVTCIFVYHIIRFTALSEKVERNFTGNFTLGNTLIALVLLYIVYDFFYVSFHRFLHIRAVYGYVHKHHHRQKSPSRGYMDASNVHPFEFVVGEYIHVLALFLVSMVIPSGIHVTTIVFFIILDGILAPMNHTRMDMSFPFGLWSVKVHDVHHRFPRANYGQYIMFWDKLFGSYLAYDDTDKPTQKNKKFE